MMWWFIILAFAIAAISGVGLAFYLRIRPQVKASNLEGHEALSEVSEAESHNN
jgi:putative exporter of polyketide antibiotics